MSIFGNFGDKVTQVWNGVKKGFSDAWNGFTGWLDDTFSPPGDTVFEEVAWNNTPSVSDSLFSPPEYAKENMEVLQGVMERPPTQFWEDPHKKTDAVFDILEKDRNDELADISDYYPETSVSSDNIDDSIDNSLASGDTVKSDLEDAYQREDEIRKHVEQREDTAYQRAVADMKAAGINPELLGVSPAAAGGGITSATRKDYSVYTAKMQAQYSLLEQEIQNNFQGSQNKKDRILDIVKSIVNGAFMAGSAGLIRKK